MEPGGSLGVCGAPRHSRPSCYPHLTHIAVIVDSRSMMAEAKPEKTLGSLLKKRMKADGGDHATATSAKGSAAEPSVIVAMTQPDPTLSMSQRLWNAAYDSLEGQDTELVQAYMRTLGKALGDNPDTCSVELADPSRRQAFMEKLVTEGKAKVAKTSKVTKGLDEFAKAILSAKPMVDLVIQNIPQAMPAAIPWAGVCAGLQVSNALSTALGVSLTLQWGGEGEGYSEALCTMVSSFCASKLTSRHCVLSDPLQPGKGEPVQS